MQLPANIKGKHFLICDDYDSMLVMVGDSLKSLGVTRITSAKSGNSGYQTILAKMTEGNPIEFVITDLMMDDGTGIDLVKQIRANAATKSLPVLMVTSKSEVSFVLESIKAGVNSYIVKPWTLEDLHKRIVEIDAKQK